MGCGLAFASPHPIFRVHFLERGIAREVLKYFYIIAEIIKDLGDSPSVKHKCCRPSFRRIRIFTPYKTGNAQSIVLYKIGYPSYIPNPSSEGMVLWEISAPYAPLNSGGTKSDKA